MTLGEIIALYRAQAQDEAEPYFCSDTLLTLYANEAQDEACRRAQLLRDSISSMCRIPYQTGDEVVQLDRRILQVMRARVTGSTRDPLAIEERDWIDRWHPNWEVDTHRDEPQVLITGMTTDALHLWPIPHEDGELRLTVHRLPLNRLADMADEPEIRVEAHPALAEWLLYRAFSRQDTELFNEKRAQAALARFEAEFGQKASVRNETWVREGRGIMPDALA